MLSHEPAALPGVPAGVAYLMAGATPEYAPLPVWQPPPPPGPPPPLYPFQEEGVCFLMERAGALLCDEMGLGKSIQAIAALARLVVAGAVRRALVLCPRSLMWDWLGKFRRWAPELQCCTPYGPPRRRYWDWRWVRGQVWIAGYETWREDCGQVEPAWFDLVILDEVQRIKNPDTALARAVHRLQAPRRWGLSGTPLENRLEELQAVCSYIVPQAAIHRSAWSAAAVREAVRPHMLRRRKDEVLPHLPAKHHREVWLELLPAQRAAYAQAEAAGRAALPGAGYAGVHAHLLALLTRLKQICNLHPETGESAKLQYLLQDLPRVFRAGQKALVFSQYPEVTLRPLLDPISRVGGVALFSGDLGQYQREELVRLFEQEEQPQVLLMSLKAGGVGLTLTRANHVYHFDHWWNPAVQAQAEDRVHRIGQHQPVHVTSLLTRGTVEEQIVRLLADKRHLFAQVMDGQEPPRLDSQALFALFGITRPTLAAPVH